jgi:hypothetical protein
MGMPMIVISRQPTAWLMPPVSIRVKTATVRDGATTTTI